MSQTIQALLAQLKTQLESIQQDRLTTKTSLTFDLITLDSPQAIAKAKQVLDKYGLLFVTNAILPHQTSVIEQRILTAYNDMFGKDMHNLPATNLRQIPATVKAGILGNKGFAYLYKQPMRKADTPTMLVDGIPAYIDHNKVYWDVNLATLTDPTNRDMLSVLLALSHAHKTMISWDSAKVSTNFKSKANPFTAPHIDFYSDITQRFQVLLNVSEEATKLFYCPGTLDPKVRTLLTQLQSDPNFFVTDGFKALKPLVAQVIRPFMLAPPPGSLIFWRSGIVHAEYTSTPTLNPEGLFQPDPKLALAQRTNQLTIRMVIGTHIPTNLSPDGLKQLAYAASQGFIPSRYTHGSNKAVVLNKMHKGKTQYKVPRPLPAKEKALTEKVIKDVQDLNLVETYFDTLDPVLQHILGVPLDPNDYWPELKALMPKKIIIKKL